MLKYATKDGDAVNRQKSLGGIPRSETTTSASCKNECGFDHRKKTEPNQTILSRILYLGVIHRTSGPTLVEKLSGQIVSDLLQLADQ